MKNMIIFATIFTAVLAMIVCIPFVYMEWNMEVWKTDTGWNAMTAIATACMALFILFAALVALWQLKENTGLRKQQAWIAMLDIWRKEDARKKRRFILRDFDFGKEDIDKLEDWYNEPRKQELENVEYILGICDIVSLMVHKRLISDEDVLESIGVSLVSCYRKCQNFIDARNRQIMVKEEYSYMYHLKTFVGEIEGKIRISGVQD